MKRIIFIYITLVSSLILCLSNLNAQDKATLIDIEGVLLDIAGKPLQGETVFSSEAGQFTITDLQGRFKVKSFTDDVVVALPKGLPRTMTYVQLGVLQSDTIRIGAYGDLNIDSKVSIPYAKCDFDRLTGSVAIITGDELSDVPTIFIQEALSGRLAGVTSTVTNSSPTEESHGLQLWGNDISEIWVDGTPNNLTETTSEVDKIYIGKDLSSSALLGGVGSEGVMMVDTRRGTPDDNRVEVKVNTGIKTPTFTPEMMGAVAYSNYYNQALNNDGMPDAYSPEAIQAYKNNTDPIRYPNVDYYDYFLNDNAKYTQVGANMSGGSQTASYFSHLGYYKTEGLDAQGEGRDYERFRVKSNLVIKLRTFGTLDLGIGASFSNSNYPNMSADSMTTTMYNYPSNSVPLILNDSTFGYSSQYPNNLLVNLAETGVSKTNNRDVFSRMGLDLDLGNLLNGLTFRGDLNVSVKNSLTKQMEPTAATAEPIFVTDTDGGSSTVFISRSLYNPVWDFSHKDDSVSRSYFVAGNFDYDRVFAEKHFLKAKALTSFTLKNGSNYEQDVRMMNYGVSANYTYDYRYVLEGSVTRSGNQSIKGENQYANFYSTGAAWLVSNERFLNNVKAINYLKLRANYGKSGVWFGQLDDNKLTYYLDQNLYNKGDGSYLFGKNGKSASAASLRRVFTGSDGVKWPSRYVLNYGFDMQMFQNRLTLALNVFNQRTTDELILPTNLYSLITANVDFLPYVNYGERVNKGFDFQASYNNNIGDLRYTIGGNMMYKVSTVNSGNELSYPESGRSTLGIPSDVIMGLDADGLFATEADAQGSNQQFGLIQVGDIKYKDTYQEAGNAINEKDYHEIGHANRIFYGVNAVFNYKNFTLGVHGEGACGGSIIDDLTWNRGGYNYQASVTDRVASGDLPRPTILGGDNNYINSTYWLRNASYFNLKSLNLAYTLPRSLTSRLGIETIKTYVAGKNLLVLSHLDDMYAPNTESAYSMYPITKAFELGLEVSF